MKKIGRKSLKNVLAVQGKNLTELTAMVNDLIEAYVEVPKHVHAHIASLPTESKLCYNQVAINWEDRRPYHVHSKVILQPIVQKQHTLAKIIIMTVTVLVITYCISIRL